MSLPPRKSSPSPPMFPTYHYVLSPISKLVLYLSFFIFSNCVHLSPQIYCGDDGVPIHTEEDGVQICLRCEEGCMQNDDLLKDFGKTKKEVSKH